MRGTPRRGPDWLLAASYAVALHAIVIALLVVSFRIVSRDEVSAPVMQAVVVREPTPEVVEQEKDKQEAQRKKREADMQRAAEEQQRKEAERVRLETERKKQEEEKKQRDDAQKKKEETERQKLAAQEEKKKQDVQRKKEEKQRQQRAEQTLKEQLAEEEKSRAVAKAARRAPEADKFKAAIRQKVSRQWVRPSASRKDLQCTVRVRLLPGGEVLEAKVVRSSGDTIFDRSVENAVYKAAPLPLPEDAELFEHFREIEFIFRPEE